MENGQQFRVDKFLWSVRMFKTRAQSTEACRKGRITINDVTVKPSRHIRAGETIKIRKDFFVQTIVAKDFPKTRIPFKLLQQYIDDQTPPDEMKKLQLQNSFFIRREKGSGRPTKKERRDIDKISLD
jgi:ribosome-associated heat shock protein Hsp15